MNPWTAEQWNISAQGRVVQTFGISKARALAAAAGSHIGATHPSLPDKPKKIQQTFITRRTTVIQQIIQGAGYSGDGPPEDT